MFTALTKRTEQLFLASLTLFFSHQVAAQMYVNEEWVYSSGVADNLDWASSIFDANSDLIVVSNKSVTSSNSDVLVTKYNPEGVVIWQEAFDGTASTFDYGVKALSDANGNIFVTAALSGTGTELDFGLLKYDSNGGLTWVASWNGANDLIDVPIGMALDPSGNIYVAGLSHTSLTNLDYAVVKFGPTGQVLWNATYDHAGFSDIPSGLELDAFYNPVITGGSASNANDWDFATVVYNAATGAQQTVSRVTVPGFGLDKATAIAKDINANLYVTGYAEVNGIKEIQTIKLDPAFNLAWTSNYANGGINDVAKAIDTDDSGNIYITGSTANNYGGSEIVTIKYDDSGNELWGKRHSGVEPSFFAVGNKVIIDAEGNCLVTGSVNDGTEQDFITIAYSSNGELLWERLHDGGFGDDEGLDIISDPDGNIYITGLSNTGNGAEYTTVKYNTLEKIDSYLYDTSGQAICVANELIIKFDPTIVNTGLIDETGILFAPLQEFVPTNVVNDVANAIGNETDPAELMAYKIYRNLSSEAQMSTSRLGNEVPVPAFWSTLLVSAPTLVDPVLIAANVTQVQDVYYAEPNYIYYLDGIPNDPHINNDLQPNLVPTASVPNAHINASVAWDIQTGQEYVRAGIVDDGVYHDHADFDVPSPGLNKGAEGYNWPQSTGAFNVPQPDGAHGTAIAGIIGAVRDNNTGIAGIAGGSVAEETQTGVKIIALDASPDGVVLTTSLIAPALRTGCGDVAPFPPGGPGYSVHVMNNSWSGLILSTTIEHAIYFCHDNEVTMVGSKSKGATTSNVPFFSFPADYDDKWIISVGGSGNDGRYVDGSNGSFNNWVSNFGNGTDLIAPSTEDIVYSTVPDPTQTTYPFNTANCPNYQPFYGCIEGLSLAPPHVSGVAALMLSEHNLLNGVPNDLAPEDVENVMEASATDIVGIGANGEVYGVGEDPYNGWGRIDAGLAVQRVQFPAYHVWHSGLPLSSTQTQGATQQITYHDYYGYVPPGTYNAYPVVVSQTYSETFAAGVNIIDHWARSSATTGIADANSNHIYDYNAVEITAAVVNNNQADLTLETRAWFIVDDLSGNPVNVWVPAPPSQLITRFSLHLCDGNIVGMNDAVSNANDLHVFPSPSNNNITIQWSGDSFSDGYIRVFDATGKILLHKFVPNGKSLNLPINVSDWSSGTYAIQFTRGDVTMVQRFLKN